VTSLFRSLKFGAAVVAAALVLAGTSASSYAASGSVRMTVTKVGFILGAGGGSGTLNFNGKRYALSIGGISVGTFGASRADLVGRASNLRTAADIGGTYAAVGAGAAVVKGATTARLRNANGVILELRGSQVGLEVSIDLSGMVVSLR